MENRENKINQLIHGQRTALIATLVTLFLVAMKIGIGHLFNSKILIADGFHSAADL